jgi:hypothetical protein
LLLVLGELDQTPQLVVLVAGLAVRFVLFGLDHLVNSHQLP